MQPLDVMLAAGLFALAIGLGWLVYVTQQEKRAARTSAAPAGDDPVVRFRALTSDTLAAARENAALVTKVQAAVQAGVR